jgi:alkyl sulfatase BDS1-like metallo-beta-lactamase superfamily hydrolase
MGKTIGLNITFTDMAPGSRAAFRLTVKNAVLNYGQPLGAPDAGLTLTKSTLAAIMMGLMTMEQARERGLLVFTGRPEAFAEIMSLLGTFAPLFPIVAPRDEDWGT